MTQFGPFAGLHPQIREPIKELFAVMLSKAKGDQEMLDGIALMMKDAAADPEGFTLKLSGGINHMVEEEGAEGELWALKEKHGSQSGGGKRGTALKVPVELCTDEGLVPEYNTFDKARTDVTNSFARGLLSEEEKTSALEKQFARREEVKKLIQENVDLRCQREHGKSWSQLKDIAKAQRKLVRTAQTALAGLDATVQQIGNMADKQGELHKAASSGSFSAETMLKEKEAKAALRKEQQEAKKAAKEAKEKEEEKADPEKFAAKRKASDEQKEAAKAKALANKAQKTKAAAEVAAKKAFEKAEQLQEKAEQLRKASSEDIRKWTNGQSQKEEEEEKRAAVVNSDDD